MYGSTLITSMRTTTWPSAGSGCSRSTSRKSWGVGSPCGRAASSHSRVVTVMARSCSAEVGPLRGWRGQSARGGGGGGRGGGGGGGVGGVWGAGCGVVFFFFFLLFKHAGD